MNGPVCTLTNIRLIYMFVAFTAVTRILGMIKWVAYNSTLPFLGCLYSVLCCLWFITDILMMMKQHRLGFEFIFATLTHESLSFLVTCITLRDEHDDKYN
jgi:hypothetical protein